MPAMPTPNTIKQITLGEFQGNVTPPNSRPSSTINVIPKMEKLPNQSTAFIPGIMAVFGLCTSRKSKIRMKEVKQIGTLIQKHQRQEREVLKMPPSTGPTELAKTQMVLVRAKARVRLLLTINSRSNTGRFRTGKPQTK